MSKRDREMVVGLDIGTTKICAVVGERVNGDINIIGIGTHPSKGLRRGVVVNIETTVQSIRKAVDEASLMAGCDVRSVYAGIAGGHIKGINGHGVIAIKNREITDSDIKRVINAASAVVVPLDRKLIHVLPQEFIVDDQDGIKNPVGMLGVRLEGKVHIVTGAITSAQNIIRCANRAGLHVNEVVLEQLGSGEAVLTDEEKDIGVALVDIGGGTTDLVIFSEGSIKYTAVLALAGNHVTSDISLGLRTPHEEAERLKLRYGCAMASMVNKDETIEVPSVGGRKNRILSRQTLSEIIEARAEEILTFVHGEIIRSGYKSILAGGVVLTGGSALLEGIVELGEQVFNLPVRRGGPVGIGGLRDLVNSPVYATGVGLVLYGAKNDRSGGFAPYREGGVHRVIGRLKDWLGEFF
ncbi:MAG: cell division protein FtsA [Deltaproteobacteria bacterium]|nr:cell division protein FtsA [Deltaproteobacteria bacterium]MBW2121805.1 cell division protein FtsA [Deltaproteobacteria bacterium]